MKFIDSNCCLGKLSVPMPNSIETAEELEYQYGVVPKIMEFRVRDGCRFRIPRPRASSLLPSRSRK